MLFFQGMDLETPTPLYDEDDSVPLDDFMPKFSGDGWELMLRHPIKKKSFMAERYWKPCYVRMNGNTLYVYNAKTDPKPIHVSFFFNIFIITLTIKFSILIPFIMAHELK